MTDRGHFLHTGILRALGRHIDHLQFRFEKADLNRTGTIWGTYGFTLGDVRRLHADLRAVELGDS